jgi:hypothetical protein
MIFAASRCPCPKPQRCIAGDNSVIRVEDREAYMKALESASIETDIRPFATFIAERVKWSIEQSEKSSQHKAH